MALAGFSTDRNMFRFVTAFAIVFLVLFGGWIWVVPHGKGNAGNAHEHEVARTNGSSEQFTAACVTERSSLLSAAALPGFQQVAYNSFTSPPSHGLPGTQVSSPAVSDFLKGATIGYMNDRVFQKPFITYELIWEKAHHYQVTSIPNSPLQGQTVAMLKGLLEAYELVTVYSRQSGAVAFAREIEADVRNAGFTWRTLGGSLSGDDLALEYLGPPNETGGAAALYEHELRIEVVSKNVEYDFAFRSGSSLSLSRAESIVQRAVREVNRCRH